MQPSAYGTPLDYGIIVLYLVFIFGLGGALARFNRSTKDFFIGGQRFGWWVIALSLVASTVGSYSFVKYSAMSYEHGLAGTMAYLNDWFWMPLFMFVWLPVIYYARVTSVPEYFERRFDARARAMATALLLIYTVGYIGINLFTMGKVVAQLLGYEQTLGPIFISAFLIAAICAAYVTSGGQAAVILSDVVQGVLLLAAGLWLFALGIDYLGGFGMLWSGLSTAQKLPLAPYNSPPGFNFIGVFWQDAVNQGIVVYFLNQGGMLRFLSGRSVDTGRKAATWLLLFLQPVAALAVCNAGWIGRAMVNHGLIAAGSKPDEIFMVVSHVLSQPGVFGFILAALTAALMSTADTLINAAASIWVNDVWRLYVKPDAPDTYHLKIGRIASVSAAAIGLAMVPLYFALGTIYRAHGAFTAAIGPPMAVAVLMGALWKRYTPAAAFWTMLGGISAIVVSFPWPKLVSPFAMGVAMDPDPWKAYSFQRALYGLVVSLVIAVVVTLFTKPRPASELVGLVVGTLDEARRRFKGHSRVNETAGPKQRLKLATVASDACQILDAGTVTELKRWIVYARPALMRKLETESGDLVIVADARPLLGDLRGAHAIIEPAPDGMELDDEALGIPAALLDDGQLDGARPAMVQRLL